MKPAEYQIHVGKEILGSSKKIREALIAREVEAEVRRRVDLAKQAVDRYRSMENDVPKPEEADLHEVLGADGSTLVPGGWSKEGLKRKQKREKEIKEHEKKLETLSDLISDALTVNEVSDWEKLEKALKEFKK